MQTRLFSRIHTTARALLLLTGAWLALAACAAAPALLNSERIAAKFGSYQVSVVAQDASKRVSSLASLEDGQPVTRTLAIVLFEPQQDAYLDLHQQILAGSSIGSTFRAAGWDIAKPLLFTGPVVVPAAAGLAGQLMRMPLPAELAIHGYRFDVSKDDQTFTYAVIIELHHPDYLDVAELQQIYGARPDSLEEPALRALTASVLLELSAGR